MTKLSEKYIAGFLDSDGSIQVMWRALDRANSDPSILRPYLSLEWSQLTCNDEVLQRIKECVGGEISEREATKGSTLKLFGGPAVQLLSRIEKYLVVKRHYARVVLELLGKPHKVELAKAYLKAQRKVKGGLPNYPSRKWLAGYFDGDGCFQCRVAKGRTTGQLVAEITASAYDAEGVEILAKVFGGSLTTSNPSQNNPLVCWTLTMPPSKAIEFVGYFAKELITKQAQAYFILGCAEMGHFRDGKSISAILKHLKTQPHRLSEPKADVAELIRQVEALPCMRSERIAAKVQSRGRLANGTFV